MQKKLLTVAVAGALAAPGLAVAQLAPGTAGAEAYGYINMSFGQYKISAPTQQGANVGYGDVSKWDVASHASNVGLRGRENLGGGLTAWAQVETNAAMERSNNVANTSGIASRNSAVGLQGNFGNVFIGQWTTPWADLDGLWGVGTVGGWGPITSIIGRGQTTGTAPAANCANAGSGVGSVASCDEVEGGGGVGHAFWRRASQSIAYQSPVFSGVQFKILYQTNESKTNGGTAGTASAGTVKNDPSLYSASVQWTGMGGRARIGLALDGHKEFTTQGQTDTGTAIKGGWDFGFMDIGLAYEAMKYKTIAGDCDAKQYGIGIAIPVGQGAIRGSYAVAKDIKGTYGAGVAVPAGGFGATSCGGAATATFDPSDNGGKTYNLGYDYRFSKRTTVGFGYAVIKNDTAGAFNWSGTPKNQAGLSSAGVLAGSDPSTFFVNMIHRF